VLKDKSEIEVLSPAGNLSHVQAAIDGGANAVYVGLKGFSARPDGWSMDLSDIAEAAEMLHAAGRKLHVAINAELPEKRQAQLRNAVDHLRHLSINALIIGDFGVMSLLRDVGSEIPIHASTLLGLYNSEGIRFVQNQFGVRRIVFSTSLYADEMAELHYQCPDMEFELIAHGGVCFNDNRRCRQPHYLHEEEFCVGCKQLYDVQLAPASGRIPSDLSAVPSQLRPSNPDQKGDRLIWSPEIDLSRNVAFFMSIGICSFKIEGRTRTDEYVFETARKYRNAVDKALSDPEFGDPDITNYYYFEHQSRMNVGG